MNLLTKILNQRPEDPLSILESLNRTTQWEWFHPKLDTLRDDPEMQPTYEMAEKQKALFIRGGGEGEQEMEEEVVSERTDGGQDWGCSCLPQMLPTAQRAGHAVLSYMPRVLFLIVRAEGTEV